ncbi:MAG: hypothetical protein GXX82_16580 [Syntrophorhabdus sp.]|nr:hypothetical protein [Syntrophorhabdus sp.]
MQHSYNITNVIAKGGVAYRAAVNAALQALVSNNLGEEATATPYVGMLQWFDEGTTWILKAYTGVEGHEWVTILTIETSTGTVTFSEEGIAFATASEVLAGAITNKILAPSTLNAELVKNLKPVVNASVNKLDLLTKSGGAVPDSDNVITVAIPDGNGYTFRKRSGAYLSGTSQFILADATAYWGAMSGADKIKVHKYAIFDGTGIVWALSRFAGFHNVPATTTPGDDDYVLLEDGSTYTRSASHHCVCVGEAWANYNTANTPNWTFYDSSTSAELAPQVIWNPKSDYGKSVSLATTITQASDIGQSVVSAVVKQAGVYEISYRHSASSSAGAYCIGDVIIKTGSATYGSATIQSQNRHCNIDDAGIAVGNSDSMSTYKKKVYLNNGDTIHGGSNVYSASGNRSVHGNDTYIGCTMLSFRRTD